MDKILGEEDLKGLEEEIDNAVDRLFVEKKKGGVESFLKETAPITPPLKPPVLKPPVTPPSFEPFTEPMVVEPLIDSPMPEATAEPSLLEPSLEMENIFDFESSTPSPPPPPPVPFLKSIDKMEAQLLSLEWEITDEKLKTTREEVLALREVLKQKADISTVLSNMEKVLTHMIRNEEQIQPSWIKFLLDAKETIKLLMKKETEREIQTYKQLAYLGIDARFACLEGMKEPKAVLPVLPREEGMDQKGISVLGEKKIEEMSYQMNSFMEKVEDIFNTMKQQLSRLEESMRTSPALPEERSAKPVSLTIFKVEKKLFGVESEKVFKLFKVPNTFQEKYSNQEKIRLRDVEVKMVNLKKIFSIPGEEPAGQMRILTVKDNGEYIGLMVDQVLKKLSTPSEKGEPESDYFSGVIHSTYLEQPVEIPILDLKKF